MNDSVPEGAITSRSEDERAFKNVGLKLQYGRDKANSHSLSQSSTVDNEGESKMNENKHTIKCVIADNRLETVRTELARVGKCNGHPLVIIKELSCNKLMDNERHQVNGYVRHEIAYNRHGYKKRNNGKLCVKNSVGGICNNVVSARCLMLTNVIVKVIVQGSETVILIKT